MSDRPTGANGKRSEAWGTTSECPACGRCLCFGCHPHGPCLDQHEALPVEAFAEAASRLDGQSAGWHCVPASSPRVGLQMRSRIDAITSHLS